jgi:hypothetical protein
MNALSLALVVLKLVPVIAEAVRSVEELDARPGNGSVKLSTVLTLVKTAVEVAYPDGSVKFEAIVTSVTTIVGALVTFYNDLGTFKKAVKA